MTIGEPMKPAGAWEVRRRITIPALTHAADTLTVQHALTPLLGIRKVTSDVRKQRIIVRYDITAGDIQTIVDRLEEIGFPPSDNWWSRCKLSWYRFTDENGRANANQPAAACCNKPPRKRRE